MKYKNKKRVIKLLKAKRRIAQAIKNRLVPEVSVVLVVDIIHYSLMHLVN